MFTLYSHARRDSNSSSEEEEGPLHPSGSSRVKRALFGPTDHEENLRFVKNELKKARNEASSRWNFDFDSGKPLNGAFEWEEVASSTAGVTVCNPEKHSFKSSSVSEEDSEEHFFKSSSACDESEAAKENRVGGHSAGDLGQCPRESRLSEERGGDQEDGGGGGGGGAGCDLRAQPPASVTPPTPAAAASQSQPSSSHLGARPKELTEAKERKLTEIYRSRKPRSKSSSNLKKVKRLAAHEARTRSPSVKARDTAAGAAESAAAREVAAAADTAQDSGSE